MRSFIISLVLILVLIGCAVFNNCYIKSVSEQMTSIIENLPGNGNDEADARAEIDRLNDIWQKNLTPISLTVSRKYIAEISLALSNMKEAYATGEEYDFAASKKAALHSLATLRDTQCTSLASII